MSRLETQMCEYISGKTSGKAKAPGDGSWTRGHDPYGYHGNTYHGNNEYVGFIPKQNVLMIQPCHQNSLLMAHFLVHDVLRQNGAFWGWGEYNSKNPYPCGNRTFPHEVHHYSLWSTRLQEWDNIARIHAHAEIWHYWMRFLTRARKHEAEGQVLSGPAKLQVW